jgi:hypothetical protein
MSSGAFALGAGNHSLTIVAVAGDPFGGVGYFRITAEVPEPATLALLGAGLIALGLALRRTRAAKRSAHRRA